MRIVSLLPSATEVCFALGAGAEVVGVTFECDYPAAARSRRIVSTTALPDGLAPGEIDAVVRRMVAAGEDLYHLDAGVLRALDPDVVITQDLCAVCAIEVRDVGEALEYLGCRAEVVSTDPHNLDEVLRSIETIGTAIGRDATALVADLRTRLTELGTGGNRGRRGAVDGGAVAPGAGDRGVRRDVPARASSVSGGVAAGADGVGVGGPSGDSGLGDGGNAGANGVEVGGPSGDSGLGDGGNAGANGVEVGGPSGDSGLGDGGNAGADALAVGPRVALLEWTEPPFAPGHWLPEMVALAGGTNVLGQAGQRSVAISWEMVWAARPEVIVSAPCGFDLEGSARLTEGVLHQLPPGIPVWAVDANGYFARPGPRLVDGIELLAAILRGETPHHATRVR